MKIITSIQHPAWAHQFKCIIKSLEKKGHDVKILAIDKDRSLELLDSFNIKYDIIASHTGKGVVQKFFILISFTLKTLFRSIIFKPDIFIGRATPNMSISSFILKKPHLVFEDTENAGIGLLFAKLFSTDIITPVNFAKDLGKKHKRTDTYKELFYLHPNYFKPDESVLSELKISPDEIFTIIRFVSWQAYHDIGIKGLSLEMKQEAIETFKKFGKVFITSESELPKNFEAYKLNLPVDRIHHLLYYATLVYGEGRTMASEAAVLGTHAVYINKALRGYTAEQEKKYNLVYNFDLSLGSQKKSISKGREILENSNSWDSGKKKVIRLLEDKMDGTNLMMDRIEEYLHI